MKITQRMLRKIISEEIKKSNKRNIAEGSKDRPVRVTPAYINKLIREEYAAFQNQKRIVEARRRRRLAEARRRKETVYFY
tara:strand:- start:297 stop:536 length:240 start_codon:yes stop_codon:yes gene_type:complete